MQNDTETQTLVDNAIVEQEYMSLLTGAVNALFYAQHHSSNSHLNENCDSVFLYSGDTLDFMPEPIFILKLSETTCSHFMPDNKIRSGLLSIQCNGKLNSPGTRMIIKQSNYLADGIAYTSDSTLLFVKTVGSSQWTVNAQVIHATCSTVNYEIKYNCTKCLRLYSENMQTNAFTSSDSYGMASGTNRFGKKYTSTVNELTPLFLNTNCRYFQKGFQEIANEGSLNYKVDYGNGNCDDSASYYILENTVKFKLK